MHDHCLNIYMLAKNERNLPWTFQVMARRIWAIFSQSPVVTKTELSKINYRGCFHHWWLSRKRHYAKTFQKGNFQPDLGTIMPRTRMTSSRARHVARDVTDVKQIGIEELSMPNFEFWKSDHYWPRYGYFRETMSNPKNETWHWTDLQSTVIFLNPGKGEDCQRGDRNKLTTGPHK